MPRSARQGSAPRRARRPAGGDGAPAAEPLTFSITQLGSAGDGLARLPDGRMAYVAGALPGERVTALPGARRGEGVAARLVSVLSPSPDRAAPPCRHASVCGGCSTQHMGEALYAAWKRGLAEAALARAGFPNPALAALARSLPNTRRRADLALRREGGRMIVGFHGRKSGVVADVPGCLILHPALLAAAEALRGAGGRFPLAFREASAVLTLAREGVDLWLVAEAAPDGPARSGLAAFAREAGLARLSWSRPGDEAEPIAALRQPSVRFGEVDVPIPPGAFLQATEAGERAIVTAVMAALAGLGEGARVADLYAGCGTLTFPLSRRFRVFAAEGDAAAASALLAAARGAGLPGRVTAEQRDLAARPLLPVEQKRLAAVVLDPPRDGAARQVAALAAGGVGKIVYVSCNPNALARDGRMLREAGFRLDSAVPIDQFPWSPHLECVASFSR